MTDKLKAIMFWLAIFGADVCITLDKQHGIVAFLMTAALIGILA